MDRAPKRGFSTSEFERRLDKAQRFMQAKQLDAILLSTQANIQYFTGFKTQFWKSPTRPYFVVLPARGKPVAVIPTISATGMQATWVEDIITWDSPNPADDGVTLLSKVLKKCAKHHKRIGLPLGQESRLGMPYLDFLKLEAVGCEWVDVSVGLHQIRAIKSPAEVEKIRAACFYAHTGFEMLASHAAVGQTERAICKQMNKNILDAGADSVEYLICGSGHDGYDSIIMGPTDRIIGDQDIMMIDTGSTYDGYYTDFCRNIAFGNPSDEAKRANDCVHDSIDAAFKVARPGVTTSQIYRAMWAVLEQGGALGNEVGRMGHGLGIELTEWPSHTPTDNTVIEAGMVLTLEPGMYYKPGKSLVHEENILITEDGAQWLTTRAIRGFMML